jgi:hypothetical protein
MTTTPTAVTPPSTPTINPFFDTDRINDSWCDINFKSGCSSAGSSHPLNQSINPEILSKLLQDAQRDPTLPHAIVISSSNQPSTSISVQSSPKSPQTPNVLLMHRHHHHIHQLQQHPQQQQQLQLQRSDIHKSQIQSLNETQLILDQSNLEITQPIKNNSADWMWYWSSRPQAQPPK